MVTQGKYAPKVILIIKCSLLISHIEKSFKISDFAALKSFCL